MKRTIFLAAILGSLVTLVSGAGAQERNELSGLIGRTFVSDQGVTGLARPALFSPREHGLSVEANYGRRLMDFGLVGLTGEVPFVVNFQRKCAFRREPCPQGLQVIFRYALDTRQSFP